MSDLQDRIDQLSPQRLKLLALQLQEKLDAAERAQRAAAEPIAIVGMSCRLPGAAGPEAYWELLRDGVDAVREVPPDRWDADAYYDPDPDVPGKMATRWGGFLDRIDGFDPQLFGIAPREARSLDPQQRLLLEVAWEALENAGIAPDQLAGSATGVYVGVCNGDYGQMLLGDESDDLDMYVSTGSAASVASGRLSYVLGLQGPAMTVDTACSSSLVALHLAVRGVREGACRTALAGGVNVILSPTTTITLSRAKMMASEGRCRAFDAHGDGFVRGEGCGLVVLKRVSDAIADGDRILAVIRGSATNQDGRSNGLTAPNGPSQVAVIRAALADAGVDPSAVGYVEAHGTGTSLGDPIEAQALGAALGTGRDDDHRLLVGSAKTNLGHLESAAGIAGLLKVVLSLQHGELPPSLHFDEPNPHIPWDRLPIDVVTRRTPWPSERPRIAGVSSFGFSGSNAHIVLEAAPQPEPHQGIGEVVGERPAHVLTLSAASEPALRELSARVSASPALDPGASLADAAFTANVGRSDLAERLAVVAGDAAAARAALDAFADGTDDEHVITGTVAGQRTPQVAFLFTGHGSQYVGMGRALYDAQPVFREAIDRCAELLAGRMDRPLLDALFSDEPDAELGGPLIDSMAYAQPALFALEYALSELWASWGVRPTVVAGHSAGEYVAAVVAGVMSLEDGLELIATRGRLMASLPPNGEMATVFATEERVRDAIAATDGAVSIAAVNGPESIALSGTDGALSTVLDELRAEGVEVRPLAIPIAAHSPQVEPILDEFERVAGSVRYSPPSLDVVSGMTGALATGDDLTNAAYWRHHLRRPVRFADAVHTIHDEGVRIYVELGPHPTLLNMARHVVPERESAWLPSLRNGHDEWVQVLSSAGGLYTRGVAIDWAGFDAPYGRRKVALPTYPFQRERYWADAAGRTRRDVGEHPLLGHRLRSPVVDDVVFETRLSASWPAFLEHHRIFGTVLLPSPAYVEMALAAAVALGRGPSAVENLGIREALVLPEEGERTLQLVLRSSGESMRFEFHSAAADGDSWTLHATGTLVPAADADTSPDFVPSDAQARCTEQIDGADYYRRLFDLGLEFGEQFRGVAEVWRRPGEAVGRIVLPESLRYDARSYGIHPALLDACFHVLGAPLEADDEGAYLLIGIDRFRLHASPGGVLWNHTVLHEGFDVPGGTFTGDIRLYAEDGTLVAEALGLQLRHATREALLRATRQLGHDWFYEVDWVSADDSADRPSDRPSVPRTSFATPADLAGQLAASLPDRRDEGEVDDYADLMDALDRRSLTLVEQALTRLGLDFDADDRFTTDSLADRCGVVPRHGRLLDRLLSLLADAGRLDRLDGADGWRTRPGADAATPRDGATESASAGPEAVLVERCGGALDAALVGDAEPLDLLFPGGSRTDVEATYRDSPSARVINSLVADAVATIAGELPDDQPVRVLEIGAGTGATTASVLAALPDGRAEYRFTDVSPSFIAGAEDRLGAREGFQAGLFDVERAPAEQGLPSHGYDVVIAANVLHATADVDRSLANATSLLAPGGALLLVEGIRQRPWVDITFGLTEGWWRFDDGRRVDHPLLDRASWVDALAASGLDGARTITGADEGDVVGQVLLVARAPIDTTTDPMIDPATDEARSWLLLGDGAGLADEVEALLGDATVRRVALDATTDGAAPSARLRDAIDQMPPGRPTIVHLQGLDAPSIDGLAASEVGTTAAAIATSALDAAQTLVAGEAAAELWIVTRGAQPAVGTVEAPDQSTLWGLGRVIALEHPDQWGGLVDLDPSGPIESDASVLLDVIGRGGDDDQWAIRGGERLVPRLVRRRPAEASDVVELAPEGSYLVTGGLGGLGLRVGAWIAQQGGGSIVLIGRQGLPPRDEWDGLDPDGRAAGQVAAVRAIEDLGARVEVVAADVADAASMSSLFDRFGTDLPPLRGVVHAAADLSNWNTAELPADALAAMLRPKVDGTWLLDELTRDRDLDFFVLFSTTTALWGSRDLGHYAAANQFLDGFAHHRRARGLPALSIDWGTWDEMRVASSAEREDVASAGMNPMPSDQALRIMGELLAEPDLTQVVVASVDWNLLKPVYELRRARPFLSLVASQRAASAPDLAVVPELAARLGDAPAHLRRDIVVDFLREEVAHALGAASALTVDVDQGLFEMGMDSLMSVELKGRIEVAVGTDLPSTLTFNYPTISALADHLTTDVLVAEAPDDDDDDDGLDATAFVDDAPATGSSEVGGSTTATDDLEEDELADLLADRLARLRTPGGDR